MAREFLSEYMSKGQRATFLHLRPLQKILFVRNGKTYSSVQKAYYGQITRIERTGKQVIVLNSEKLWQNGILSQRYVPKEERFQYTSSDTLYILEDVVKASREEFVNQRKAYAKARATLQQARAVQEDAFTILGVTATLTQEEFYLLRRIVFESASHLEVAEELGISVWASQKRLERIRKKLEQAFPNRRRNK